MKPLWSLIIAGTLIFTVQTSSYADTITHKDALNNANIVAKEINKTLKNSEFYPDYHFASSASLISNISGITYFNGEYHLFYEQNPYTTDKQNILIGHAVSPDFIHWMNKPFALAPSEDYDKDGIIAGNAIVDENTLYLIYTGKATKTVEGYTETKETQNLAMSKDGINFGKSANNAVIKIAPHYAGMFFSSEKFRNPFVWKKSDKYYMLIGTQFEETKDGALVLYKSDDLRNWIFVNVTAIGAKGEMGDCWESPQLITIEDNDVLLISPQGLKPNEKSFLNKYNSGWFIGKLDYNSGKFKQKGAFGLFDYGFDFYAPQIITTPDNKNILIASLYMPDSNLPEKTHKWAGMLSVPREIAVKDNKIISTPLKELEQLRTEPVYYKNQKINGNREFPQIFGDSYEIVLQVDLLNSKTFAIKLRASETQETILIYDKEAQALKLNRDKSSKEEYKITGEREVKLPLMNNQLKLQIFVDKSSVEVFANDGQIVMSSRIYPNDDSIDVIFSSDNDCKINYLNFYKLKKTH